MTPEDGRETRIIRCPACQRYYRVAGAAPAAGTRMRCTKCGNVFAFGAPPASPAAARPAAAMSSARHAPPAPAPRPPAPQPRPVTAAAPASRGARVLVATDGQEFVSLIGEVLDDAGYEQRRAGSGEEAWETIGAWRPQVALLDVALPGIPAFELCERMRAQPALADTGIILIASVFQHTRYKRAPTSLYGADDYVEKHHIRDRLVEKIVRLVPPGAPAPAGTHTPAPVSERERETLEREEQPAAASRPRQRQGLERLQESLRRFARIIISDIALYNQDLVERGIREGTLTELLAHELQEGRQLYQTRVPPGTADGGYFEEALRDFVAGRSAGRGAHPSRGRGGHGRS